MPYHSNRDWMRSTTYHAIWFSMIISLMAANQVRAEWVVSMFGGAALTENNDVRLRQAGGTDLTFRDVSYSGKNLETPPYYGARLACFLPKESHWGFAVEFFHAKLYLNGTETVHVTGTRGSAPINGSERIDSTIDSFSISHGLNFLTLDGIYRFFLGERGKNFVSRFQPYLGGGIGAVFPHVESQIAGVAYQKYQLHGPGLQGFAGLNFDLTRHWGFFAEYKFSYVDLDLNIPNGSITLTPLMHHLAAGVSFRF